MCEKEWLIRYVCYLILLKNGQTYPVVRKIESNHTCKIHSRIHFYTCFRSVFIHSFSPPFIVVMAIITLFGLFGKGKFNVHLSLFKSSIYRNSHKEKHERLIHSPLMFSLFLQILLPQAPEKSRQLVHEKAERP